MGLNEITKRILCSISPKLATRIMYFYNFKKSLHLRNPQNFNEKMQYLKLYTYYENPVITQCADKFCVRGYLRDKGYAYLLPEFLGVLVRRKSSKRLVCFSEPIRCQV
jgi:hypothetical protein